VKEVKRYSCGDVCITKAGGSSKQGSIEATGASEIVKA
jgi:hypothetical protein